MSDPERKERWVYNITVEPATYDDAYDMFAETVEERFSRPILKLMSGSSMADAVSTMQEARSGCLLVTDYSGSLQGILTERDILILLADGGSLDSPVDEHMSSPVVTVPQGSSIGKMIHTFDKNNFRHLVVTGDDSPEMVVSTGSIIHVLADHFPQAIMNVDPGNDGSFAQREGG